MLTMPDKLTDTSPEAEAVHIQLLRDASVTRRVGLAFSLSATVITLARRAIRRAMPEASAAEVGVRFVQLHYGDELARELRTYLDARPRLRAWVGGSLGRPAGV